MKSQQ